MRVFNSRPTRSLLEFVTLLRCLFLNEFSQGSYKLRFKQELSKICDSPTQNIVTVVNGTVAIEVALKANEARSRNYVFCPTQTFVASANAIVNAGKEPIFYSLDSQGMPPKELFEDSRVSESVILIVAIYGFIPFTIQELESLKSKGAILILDNAEGMGIRTKCGDSIFSTNLFFAQTFSFYSNKIISTGEGGCIVFKDNRNAAWAENYISHGRDLNKSGFYHTVIATNYRLSNLNSALGFAQAKSIQKKFNSRRKTKEIYDRKLNESIIKFHSKLVNKDFTNSLWAYPILVKNKAEFVEKMLNNGIEVRESFVSMHELGIFPTQEVIGLKKDNSFTATCQEQLVYLPFYAFMRKKDIMLVIKQVNSAI